MLDTVLSDRIEGIEKMLKIENEELIAEVDPKGAQLTHVYQRKENFDYIWNNELWPKHAPVLFPSIGRSDADTYLINGKEYPMQQHGFASDYEFEVIAHESDKLVLCLTENKETLASYPYKFKLTVTFQLIGETLDTYFTVENTNEEELSFSLGFHPGFNLPINNEGSFEDYHLTFNTADEQLNYYEIVKTPNPYRTGKLLPFMGENEKVLQLSHQTFEKGLIVFNNAIDSVQLSSGKTNHSITMYLEDFPYFCIWTKEEPDCPFLCLEPFCGLPDIVNEKQELAEKEGNRKLAAKEQATLKCSVTFA